MFEKDMGVRGLQRAVLEALQEPLALSILHSLHWSEVPALMQHGR